MRVRKKNIQRRTEREKNKDALCQEKKIDKEILA